MLQMPRIFIGAAAAATCLAGCATIGEVFQTRPVVAKTHDEAGSTHLAVLSVAPWDEYRVQLQPKFNLDAEAALSRVAKSNRQAQDVMRSFIGGGVNIQGPQSTSASTRTTNLNADGTTSSTYNRTDSSGPMTATVTQGGTTQQVPAVPPSNRPSAPTDVLTPSQVALADATTPMNSKLEFTAAAALYQEVQLLNRYVQDAVKVTGMQAFVVRLQISVLPSARRRPYDTYVDLRFTPVHSEAKADSGDSDTQPSAIKPLAFRSFREPSSTLEKEFEVPFNRPGTEVVPLLVTDDLESTLGSHQDERIAQWILGLSLLQGNVGASAGFEKKQQALKRVLGRDINSLTTVARLSRDSFRVRLGAMQGSTDLEMMVPRTHNLTMLLMVPCNLMKETAGNRAIQVRGKVRFASVDGGTVLPDRSFEEIWKATFPSSKLEEAQRVRKMLLDFENVDEDWELVQRVQEVLAKTNLVFSRFDIPRPPAPELAADVVSAPNLVLRDRVATARWLVGESLSSTDLIAEVTYISRSGDHVSVLADNVLVTEGRIAKASFPAPRVLGIKDIVSAQLSIWCPPCAFAYRGDSCSASSRGTTPGFAVFDVPHILAALPEKPETKFSLAVPITVVKQTAGATTMTAQLSYPKEQGPVRVYFDIRGGDIESYECSPSCAVAGEHQVLLGRGKLKISVKNAGERIELLAGASPDEMTSVGEVKVN
jgi:hypothetical protein